MTAIADLRDGGAMTHAREVLAQQATSLAQTFDAAAGDARALAELSRELRQVLAALGLAGGSTPDSADTFLASLTQPE